MANFSKWFQQPAGQNPRAGTRSGVRTPKMPSLQPLAGPGGVAPQPMRVAPLPAEESIQGVGASLDEANKLAAQLKAAKDMGPYATGAAPTTGTPSVPGTGPYVGSSGNSTIDKIMRTIRTRESGGNYSAHNDNNTPNPNDGAGGAYQFTPDTWRGLGGTGNAWEASPQEQDAIARKHIQGILDANGGNVRAVPGVWYYPKYWYAGTLDKVPFPSAGNTLTLGQYIDAWMRTFNSF